MSEMEAIDRSDDKLREAAMADDVVVSVPQAFQVCDADSASWLIRKICEARAYGDRVAAWAEREKRRAQREEEFFMARYGAQLRAWVSRQVEGKKQRSVSLPGGRAGFHFVGPSLVIDDNVEVLAWARVTCPTAIVTNERILKTVIGEHFEATGELPEGAHIQPEHDAFYVK